MCKFCESEDIKQINVAVSDLGILGNMKTTLEMNYLRGKHLIGAYTEFDFIDDGFGEYTEINFCPMCGRNLTEENT